jgi:hypothetical protein
MFRGNAVLLSLVAGAFVFFSTPSARAQLVFDHASNSQTADDLLEFSPGDKVTFTVNNTIEKCFDYNGSAVIKDFTQPPRGSLVELMPAPVTWKTTHQRNTTAYKVTVTKKKDAGDDCRNPKAGDVPLMDRTWEVAVSTIGWTVGVSAAFTLDELTDPQYALEPATENGVDGFTIEEDRAARDDTNQGLAMFIHLSNSGWGRDWPVVWAPITFGVGFEDNSQYYLGTSAQFGDTFFLTLGRVFGDRARLPNGLAVGDFTTDANAISTLGTRSDDAWFLGFSYQFLSSGIENKLKKVVTGGAAAPSPADEQAAKNEDKDKNKKGNQNN